MRDRLLLCVCVITRKISMLFSWTSLWKRWSRCLPMIPARSKPTLSVRTVALLPAARHARIDVYTPFTMS